MYMRGYGERTFQVERTACTFKCLREETCLTYWRNAKESSVTGPLKIKRRMARDEVRKTE